MQTLLQESSAGSSRDFMRYGLKPLVFILCLLPLILFIWDALTGGFDGKSAKYPTNYSGDLALRFLLISLAATPIRLITGTNDVLRLRRMLGLFAFAYTLLHAFTYFSFDQRFDVARLIRDLDRPFVVVGWIALAIMIPLAVTSANAMIGYLGGDRWRLLHRLVYFAALLGVIHIYLIDGRLGAKHVVPAVVYGLILAALMAIRLAHRAARQNSTRVTPQSDWMAAGDRQ